MDEMHNCLLDVQPLFSQSLKDDWATLCRLWSRSEIVMGSEVGPTWKMPDEHKVCIVFAKLFPGAKDFLLSELKNPNPVIAAYAFKCLIRVTDLRQDEIPASVRSRRDIIRAQSHSLVNERSLREYIDTFFDGDYESRKDDVLMADEQSLSWQANELAEYERNERNKH